MSIQFEVIITYFCLFLVNFNYYYLKKLKLLLFGTIINLNARISEIVIHSIYNFLGLLWNLQSGFMIKLANYFLLAQYFSLSSLIINYFIYLFRNLCLLFVRFYRDSIVNLILYS